MMLAADNGHHEIVEQLVVARADVSTKNNIYGCALPRGTSGGVVGRRLIAPARSGRMTALHCAAVNGCTKSAVALLVGGADRNVTNHVG